MPLWHGLILLTLYRINKDLTQIMPALSFRSVLLAAVLISAAAFFSSCVNEKISPDKQKNQTDTVVSELELLNRKVAESKGVAAPLLERAVYFAKNNRYNEALQDINGALDLDDKNPDVYAALSDVYMYEGKMQRSLDAVKKAIELAPGRADLEVKRARIFLTMSDYKQTFDALREALRKNPDNAEAFFISGLANEEMGDTAKAIESYQKAVLKQQNHYESLKQLGILFAEKNDRMAIDYLRNASSIKPKNPEPLYILGMYYQETNEADKALAVYEEILLIDSTFTLANYNKGYVYLVLKNEYSSAIEAFNKVLLAENENADAIYNRGLAYEQLGEYEMARKDYEAVLRLRVNDEKTINGLNRLDKVAPRK